MGSSSESFYNGTTTGQHIDTTTAGPTTTTTNTNGIVTHKPIILHLGDPIRYNRMLYSQLSSKYKIINPSPSSLEREAFKRHLQEKTWGDFSATIRPFWNTGGAMGSWDRELIELLPASMRVMASAGAGFDWVNTETLAEFGMYVWMCCMVHTLSIFDAHLSWKQPPPPQALHDRRCKA